MEHGGGDTFLFSHCRISRKKNSSFDLVVINIGLKRSHPLEGHYYSVSLAFYLCGKILGGKGK